jgi:hypothetical protein
MTRDATLFVQSGVDSNALLAPTVVWGRTRMDMAMDERCIMLTARGTLGIIIPVDAHFRTCSFIYLHIVAFPSRIYISQ